MDNVEVLRLRAERSKLQGYALPVVASADEARSLAQTVSLALAAASETERLLLLSNLHDVRRSLNGRIERLTTEMAQVRQQIAGAQRGLVALRGYGSAEARLARPPRKPG